MLPIFMNSIFKLAILYPLNKFFKVESNFPKKKLNPADN